jgi:hypothetical protein
MPHAKQPIDPRQPPTPWIPAALLGLTINTIAAGVIAMSVGLAIGAAITRPPPLR